MEGILTRASEWIDRGLCAAYFAFYLLGTWTIFCFRHAGRAIARFWRNVICAAAVRVARAVPRALLRAARWLMRELLAPVLVLVHSVRNVRTHLRAAFSRSKREGISCVFASVCYILIQIIKSLLHLLNYAAPAFAIYFLVLTVRYYSNVDYALSIRYDGYPIGYVSDLSVYDDAEAQLWDRLASIQLGREDVNDCAVSYSVVFVPARELSTSAMLCDEMIQKSISDLTVAYGVYVDGEYWGAIEDGAEMQRYLDDRLQASIDAMQSVPTVSGDTEDGEDGSEPDAAEEGGDLRYTGEVHARFLRDIKVTEGYYPLAGVVDSASMYDRFESVVKGERLYVSEAGDSAWKIARKLDDVSLDELYAMNPWMESGMIFPGDEIVTSQEVPFLEVELAAQVVYSEEIKPEIERVESSSYYVGYAKVTDSGTPGEKEITANVLYQNGIETGREVISERVISEAVPGRMVVGTKAGAGSTVSSGSATATAASGRFMWPVDGGWFTCGWGDYAGHRGMDICAAAGTNIRAADSGLVVVSVRNDSIGYGNYVMIDHGNGYKTLYAHGSARYVSAGQYVNKGDVIMAVGQTGWAYGNHCHFEIWVNGVRVNPMPYIGSKYNR